eukprot:273779-Ditylum_brightwellii.AAC.1
MDNQFGSIISAIASIQEKKNSQLTELTPNISPTQQQQKFYALTFDTPMTQSPPTGYYGTGWNNYTMSNYGYRIGAIQPTGTSQMNNQNSSTISSTQSDNVTKLGVTIR